MGLGEKGHRGKVPFSLRHVKGMCYQRDITVDDDLEHLAEVVLVRFLHHTITVPTLLFLYCNLWKEITVCSPQLKDGELYNLP